MVDDLVHAVMDVVFNPVGAVVDVVFDPVEVVHDFMGETGVSMGFRGVGTGQTAEAKHSTKEERSGSFHSFE